MKITAALMIVLALIIGILPQFSDCESQGRHLTLADGRNVPMKCHWTAQAEIGVATPLFVTGAMMAFNKRKQSLRSLSIVGGILGAAVVALPTALIGVCANPEMVCNAIMKPSLIVLGSVVIVLSVLGIVRSYQVREDLT